MLFRVLGPVDIAVSGWRAKSRSNRQVVVLATLLLEANRIVSVARLAEAVWEDAAPKTAGAQIQTCIWRLRKMFTAVGFPAGLIETAGSGYLVRVEPENIDTCLFEHHVACARAAMMDGGWSTAIADFRAALDLFRGPVLEEFQSPVIRAAAAQWEERRLAVLEDYIDLELTVGHHHEVIDHLMTLVRENPLRERFRGQLMVALSGSHRRAEALAIFRNGRRVLVDELGIEPSEMLQDLHSKLLAGDVTAPVMLSAFTETTRTPAQLPIDTADFVDIRSRTSLIARYLIGDAASRENIESIEHPRVCAIVGMCGVGKSALALRVAHAVKKHFPDGQLYADLSGSQSIPTEPAQVLRMFLRSFAVAEDAIPDDIQGMASMYRTIVARKRALVVLDDVAEAEQIRWLLPAGPQMAVILTSSSTLTGLAGVKVVGMDVPSAAEAVELLCALSAGRPAQTCVDAARRVALAVGCLPLSIRAAVACLSARPQLSLAALADRLADEDHVLDELGFGGLDFRKRLAGLVDGLPDEVRKMWLELSLLSVTEFPEWIGTAIGGGFDDRARKHLWVLAKNHLIEPVDDNSGDRKGYRFHPLVKQYARERAVAELSNAALARVAAYQP